MRHSLEQIRARVETLGPWFHNIDLEGVSTAPDHFLGDYPKVKWSGFASEIPADLSGGSVLDIGCNGGFYAIEMKRRGVGRVLGIDSDPAYLAQARFAAEIAGCEIAFEQMSVYDVGALRERFDLVLFMGVLYHLRHPLLALDLIGENVANRACAEAMLRSAGFEILSRPEAEVYVCRAAARPRGKGAVYPRRGTSP